MSLVVKRITLPLLLLFLFVIFPLSVFAQGNSFNGKETVVLEKSQTVDHDYFAAGRMVTIDGTVNGDAYVAGGQVDINGTINGDLIVAGGQITMRGKVGQNVRGAGGNILILGEVGRNISIAGGNLTLDRDAKIDGNATIAGGNIDVLSQVKNLTIAGGNARIQNGVSGNVMAGVGALDVSQNSIIHGDLEYWSSNPAKISSGTVLGKTIFHKTQTPENVNKASSKAFAGFIAGVGIFFNIVSFITSLILGLLFIRLLPIYFQKTSDVVKNKFWLSILTGFITLIVTPVFAIILMVTIIGFPLGLISLFAYGVVLYLSKLFAAAALGYWISGKANWKQTPVPTFIIGILVFYLIGFIPVIGWLVKLVAVLAGTGAIILQKKYYYVTLKNKKLI